jgi:hypothetical protein
LEEAGAQLVSATEGTNALARGIQLVVAEDYSRQLAQRTRDGLLKRFEQGAFTGGVAPYGYKVVGENGRRLLAVEPAEANVVRELAHWYLCEAVGLKLIARRMRERRIPSRRGRGWSFTSVRSMLLNPILTSRVTYNLRRMHLNRTTGRRVPRHKAEAEHLERRDESLRILTDDAFAKIADRMKRAGRNQTPHAATGIAPFTGLVYCQCGARCYRRKSQNRKGTYFYYVCSRHLTYGDCAAPGTVREDKLVEVVNGRVGRVFEREDEIIAKALALATEAARGNRDEAGRLNRELADVEAQQARYVELLMDRALPAPAKAAIGRQMTEAEQTRADLLAALDGLRDDATDNLEGLAGIVRETFAAARRNLRAAATPAQFNRFVEQFVGAMEAGPDGAVGKRKLPAASATGSVSGTVAGATRAPRQLL